jgi:hypothetical protein
VVPEGRKVDQVCTLPEGRHGFADFFQDGTYCFGLCGYAFINGCGFATVSGNTIFKIPKYADKYIKSKAILLHNRIIQTGEHNG